MLILALTLALSAVHPVGSVVLGVSTTEGTETEIVVITPAGERELIGTLSHAAGHIPKGTLAGDRLFTVSRVPDDARGVLEETVLETGARQLLLTSALPTHAPALDPTGTPLVVRQDSPRGFSIVSATAPAVPLARVDATWLSPARGVAASFLVVDGARTHLATLTSGGLTQVVPLGDSRFRSPAFSRSGFVIERALPSGRAELLAGDLARAHAPAVLRSGLAGMDPIACGDDVVSGSGEKRAALVVWRGKDGAWREQARLTADRAGVASPRACAVIAGAPVVVAWLDRGAALPGELWRFAPGGSVPLFTPAVGTAVEVYGVIGTRDGGAR